MELASSAPSTSGTLFARGLLQAGREAGNFSSEPPVAQAAILVRAGISGIQRAGKAQQGDRTLLDALYPLLDALQRAADQGQPQATAAAAAAEAAHAGADATRRLEPKIGRARWIPERAQGNVDAGAYAVALIAAAIASAID
jgi:dihydroxyacetone kinase